MTKEEEKLWKQALSIIDDNLQIVEGGIIGNRFATASKIVDFAQTQVKKITIPRVSNNEVALIEPLRNFIISKHLSKEWETFLKDYERNL
jgi:hypothetical protein